MNTRGKFLAATLRYSTTMDNSGTYRLDDLKPKEWHYSVCDSSNNERMPPREYFVYVIGLKPEVLQSQRFRDANPYYQDGQPCYYLGYSSKQPEIRALEHRDAARNNRGRLYSTIAHRYYDGLRPRKFKHLNPF